MCHGCTLNMQASPLMKAELGLDIVLGTATAVLMYKFDGVCSSSVPILFPLHVKFEKSAPFEAHRSAQRDSSRDIESL